MLGGRIVLRPMVVWALAVDSLTKSPHCDSERGWRKKTTYMDRHTNNPVGYLIDQ